MVDALDRGADGLGRVVAIAAYRYGRDDEEIARAPVVVGPVELERNPARSVRAAAQMGYVVNRRAGGAPPEGAVARAGCVGGAGATTTSSPVSPQDVMAPSLFGSLE